MYLRCTNTNKINSLYTHKHKLSPPTYSSPLTTTTLCRNLTLKTSEIVTSSSDCAFVHPVVGDLDPTSSSSELQCKWLVDSYSEACFVVVIVVITIIAGTSRPTSDSTRLSTPSTTGLL